MPQHAKRLKIRRKDLRQPDEFETLTGQLMAWLDDHRKLVIGGLAALALVGLVALGLARARTARHEAAALEFQRAHTIFEAGKFSDAAEAFSALVRNYPGAPLGRIAGLYRAHALARQGDAAAAATAYAEYLATSPEPAYLRQEALTGLGRAREATADRAGALEAYTQAGALEGPHQTDALLGAARLYEAFQQPEQAREIYARLLKEGPDPDLRELLVAKLPPDVVNVPTPPPAP